MDVQPISTDLGTLAVFDPDALQHRVREPETWWRGQPLAGLEEVATRRIAILPIGQEGIYRVALRQGAPTEEEEALIVGRVEGLGVEVVSGELFCGAAERLPGDGRGHRLSTIPGTGWLERLEPGTYALTACVLHWRTDDAWFDDEGEPLTTAPPDVLVLLDPAAAPPPLPEPLPNLLDLLPRHEAKGRAHVPGHVRRRPAAPEPGRRRRRSEGGAAPAPLDLDAIRIEAPADWAPLTPADVRAAFLEVLQGLRRPGPGPLAAQVVLAPRDPNLQRPDWRTDDLLKKFTRVREQLRVLEAKLNAAEIPDDDKVTLHGPVTGVYRSLDALAEFLALPKEP